MSDDIISRDLKHLFEFHDVHFTGYIDEWQLQKLYGEVRFGGINLSQVRAALASMGVNKNNIHINNLPAILKELDRRYYLLQDLEWEFKLLGGCGDKGSVSIELARRLLQARHGKSKADEAWEGILSARPIREAPISFSEIEVVLCDVLQATKSYDIELIKPKIPVKEKVAPKKSRENTSVVKKERNDVVKEVIHEKEDRLPNPPVKVVEKVVEERPKKEKKEKTPVDTKKAESPKKQQIRSSLKSALETEDRAELTQASKDFKAAKLPDNDGDLMKAERLLTMYKCSDALKDAISKRIIKQLEDAINQSKNGGFDRERLADITAQADKLLIRLHRLEKLRTEVLELKSSTIAEIRSYQSPPKMVHQVMIATYLLLGTPEKLTQKWSNIQTLLGKTGKEGLKRNIMQLNVNDVSISTATKARRVMGEIDLEFIRDVSAGAATFYVWVDGMITEVLSE